LTNLYHILDETLIECLNDTQKESFLHQLNKLAKQEINQNLCDIIDAKLKTGKFDNLAELLEKSSHRIFFCMCPYCGGSGILTISEGPIKKHEVDPFCCVFCGETNPHEKLMGGLKKVQVLYQMIEILKNERDRSESIDSRNPLTERVLLEQCIILLATSVEVSLKDNFCILLNIRFVRHGSSLFPHFYSDTKNDFLNIGKANKSYKDDLGINLKEKLGDDTFKKLNILMQKRHVIVHNLGIVDITFLSQSGIKCELKRAVPISVTEIEEYIAALEHVDNKLNTILADEMGKYHLENWKLLCGHYF